MYEQRYTAPAGVGAALAQSARPQVQVGSTDAQPLLPCDGEVFGLRKLLPATPEYDFNMHVMTFEPGEFLTVKEVHFNQHGLLLLEGQGIYRLGDKWCVLVERRGLSLCANHLLRRLSFAGIRSRRATPYGWRRMLCSGTALWGRSGRATSSTRTRAVTRCSPRTL